MKSNKEIIIEELTKELKPLMPNLVKDSDFVEQFATTLLSKLQTLDRDKVEEIIMDNAIRNKGALTLMTNNIADQICQLIPEEGVVIAEGEIKNIVIGGFITYKIGGQYIDDLLKQFIGKKGKLIFIEEK